MHEVWIHRGCAKEGDELVQPKEHRNGNCEYCGYEGALYRYIGWVDDVPLSTPVPTEPDTSLELSQESEAEEEEVEAESVEEEEGESTPEAEGVPEDTEDEIARLEAELARLKGAEE